MAFTQQLRKIVESIVAHVERQKKKANLLKRLLFLLQSFLEMKNRIQISAMITYCQRLKKRQSYARHKELKTGSRCAKTKTEPPPNRLGLVLHHYSILSIKVRSLVQGQVAHHVEFKHYAEVPANVAADAVNVT